MTHHQFGTPIVGDEQTGGIFEVGNAVHLQEMQTVAVDTLVPGKDLPIVVLQIDGRINKTQDTVSFVLLLPLLDAGALAGHLSAAVERVGTQEARNDFKVGISLGLEKGSA